MGIERDPKKNDQFIRLIIDSAQGAKHKIERDWKPKDAQ